jgi:hypothetical protein
MLTYKKYISHNSTDTTSKLSSIIVFRTAKKSTDPSISTIVSRTAENSDSLVQKKTAYHASDKIYIAIVTEKATTDLFFPPHPHVFDFRITPITAPISA